MLVLLNVISTILRNSNVISVKKILAMASFFNHDIIKYNYSSCILRPKFEISTTSGLVG